MTIHNVCVCLWLFPRVCVFVCVYVYVCVWVHQWQAHVDGGHGGSLLQEPRWGQTRALVLHQHLVRTLGLLLRPAMWGPMHRLWVSLPTPLSPLRPPPLPHKSYMHLVMVSVFLVWYISINIYIFLSMYIRTYIYIYICTDYLFVIVQESRTQATPTYPSVCT